MSKELEALEFICKILKEKGIDIKWLFKEQYNTIKQRLETIDNSKPSEALENLRQQAIAFEHSELAIKVANGNYNTIKQALLKSQEQEKVLEIINKKKVNIDLLYASSGVEQYNDELVRVYGMWFVKDRQLTQEEFDLLKRYCNDNII